MPRRASWTELVIGLIAVVALAAIGLGVLVFARVGQLHGSTFRLYALTDDARGVIRGSEVWLGGQKVGLVKDVQFRAPSADTSSRLLVVMDVLSSARQGIRMNSTAQVRSGGTLIGSPVVYISIGTNAAREVSSGDTVRALPQSDLESMTSQFALASRQVPEILANVKLLNKQLHGVQGTLGAFTNEKGGAAFSRTSQQLSLLSAKLSRPTGTIALAVGSSSSLTDRARVVMARADSVRTLLSSNRTSFGRFRRDSALMREVADIRNEGDTLRARMSSPAGTIGRAHSDSALVNALAGMHREMTLIMADIVRRPLRYIHF